MLRFEHSLADDFLEPEKFQSFVKQAIRAHEALVSGSGTGKEWLGWRRILSDPNDALLEEIESVAAEIRSEADLLVCIGIGGSYLGARAVIEALAPHTLSFSTRDSDDRPPTRIVFAGHHLSGAWLQRVLADMEGKSVYVNVISKSGTTLEPAIAFRFIRQWIEQNFDDSGQRIIVTTDPQRGALNAEVAEKGYRRFIIPPDLGGRFSVLSPVGLLPVASAGIDIRSFFYGAVAQMTALSSPGHNPAVEYAARRIALLRTGFSTEVLATFSPELDGLAQWWRQLFGESEGKNHDGVFPSTAQYTTDLHSIGQYMQSGRRDIFETFLLTDQNTGLCIPADPGNLDGLNYLSGQTVDAVNYAAREGTIRAHNTGGVPVMSVTLDALSPENMGRLVYFFEHAVAVGGYMLGINPFDQPGVEAYKKEMFSLLGRK